MNEDDIFKRALWAYVFVTAALWVISWAMQSNGVAFVRNPAWQLISSLRNLFSWSAAIGIGRWIYVVVCSRIQDAKAKRVAVIQEAAKRMPGASEAEARKMQLLKDQKLEASRLAQESRQREKEYRSRLREKQIQKQMRSAEDAAQTALDEF